MIYLIAFRFHSAAFLEMSLGENYVALMFTPACFSIAYHALIVEFPWLKQRNIMSLPKCKLGGAAVARLSVASPMAVSVRRQAVGFSSSAFATGSQQLRIASAPTDFRKSHQRTTTRAVQVRVSFSFD
jgi:hypothetical protein